MLGQVRRVVGGRRVERKEWSYRGHCGVLAVKDKVTGWVKSDDVDVSCVCLQWRTVSYTYIIHRGEGGHSGARGGGVPWGGGGVPWGGGGALRFN